ncbi:PREDICTED: LOW QUALITY PROTEIN: dehydration-responsive element-binding protein 1E-like [Tarenaya hassleriana]|uniref:LOW QUALITY PROTEIN: dehydration-responsive element-binding protein 1E-like n=1 Tax=Tarenaya hassleriana TaxID=28532 RepID=UPI00053C6F6B|nr:PREDICTED: LOW QUALITY PROTEIN: dehydration-responsive element-binding protein 1E-like [Tarenaya hassleriana]
MENDDFVLAEMRPKKRAGRRVFKETRHPVYRGIRRRNGDKWVCEVREPKHQRRIWLGTYPTAEMAARAHDVAALASAAPPLRGRSATLNFADSAWCLPAAESDDPDDIRRAAAAAAEIFRPPEMGNGLITVMPSDGGGSAEEEEEEEEDTAGMMSRLAAEPLMSPPRTMYYGDVGSSVYMDDDACYGDMSLWSY